MIQAGAARTSAIPAILYSVNIQDILAALDAEIDRLMKARNILAESSSEVGRTSSHNPSVQPARPRSISEEGRKRIAAAQRRRWAKKKANVSASSKKAAKHSRKAAVKATESVAVTRVPAKSRPEKRHRASKQPSASGALSHAAGIVAVNRAAATA